MLVILKRQIESVPKRSESGHKKVQTTKKEPKKDKSAETLLLQLKNQELLEEKAKNQELQRHIEILKKRLYAKPETTPTSDPSVPSSTQIKESLTLISTLKESLPQLCQNSNPKSTQREITKILT